MRRFIAATLAALSVAVPARAEFEAGREAFEKGDYTKALNEFLPSVMEGNTDAQFYLALMYEKGAGVPRNPAQSFKWYNLAAHQGSPEALLTLAVPHSGGSVGRARVTWGRRSGTARQTPATFQRPTRTNRQPRARWYCLDAWVT